MGDKIYQMVQSAEGRVEVQVWGWRLNLVPQCRAANHSRVVWWEAQIWAQHSHVRTMLHFRWFYNFLAQKDFLYHMSFNFQVLGYSFVGMERMSRCSIIFSAPGAQVHIYCLGWSFFKKLILVLFVPTHYFSSYQLPLICCMPCAYSPLPLVLLFPHTYFSNPYK